MARIKFERRDRREKRTRQNNIENKRISSHKSCPFADCFLLTPVFHGYAPQLYSISQDQ